MLESAKFLLGAALALLIVAWLANLAALNMKQRARDTTKDREFARVGAGTPSPTALRETTTSERASSGRSPAHLIGTWSVILALVALSAYIVIRMLETGHGPFSNQHEFAVSFVWGILAAYIYFEWRHHMRATSIIVIAVAAALLLYGMNLDTSVRPLMPALQNNLLLTLHVGTAMLSYGAACVSFGAAVLYLIRPYVRWKAMPEADVLDEVAYRAAVITYPLLTVMIILGAVWAQTAWGRFWGWDPKETAALVTWLIWSGYLHARVARGWRGRRAAWLLIIGFASVLFAYFGNHFFGGLHSYA